MESSARRSFKGSIRSIEPDKKSKSHYGVTFGGDNRFLLSKQWLTPDYKKLVWKRVEVCMGAGDQIIQIFLAGWKELVYESADVIKQLFLCVDSESYKKERAQKVVNDPRWQLRCESFKKNLPSYWRLFFPDLERMWPQSFRFDQIVQLTLIDSLNAAIATCNPLYAQKNRQRLRDLYCEYLFLAQLDMNTPTITYEEFTKFLEEILDYEESYDKRQDEKLLNDVKYTLENYPSLALSKWRKNLEDDRQDQARIRSKKIPWELREIVKVEKPSPPYSLDEIIAISYVYALRKVYCYAFTYEGTPEYDIERCISGLYFKYKEFAKHATPKVAKRFYLTYDDFSNDIQQVIRSLLW